MNSNLNTNVYGIGWALLAGMLFTVMMALVKTLGSRLPSVEIVFFRSAVQLVVMLAVCSRIGFSSLSTQQPLLQVARALISVFLINCNFYAFTKMSLADVTAIGFSRNLFIVVLAVLFLKERPGILRLLVTVVGFIGILVIVRPGSGVFEGVALIALAGACLGACMMTLVRRLTSTDSNMALMTFHSFAVVAAVSVPVSMVWVTPTANELLLLLAMAVVGILGQWCMIQAFRRGEAMVVAPTSYVRLIYAALFGFILFGEVPDSFTVIGALLIIGSSFFLIMQETRTTRVKPGPPVPGEMP
jgi:drug/metabolite transporter (DMT)-like permease